MEEISGYIGDYYRRLQSDDVTDFSWRGVEAGDTASMLTHLCFHTSIQGCSARCHPCLCQALYYVLNYRHSGKRSPQWASDQLGKGAAAVESKMRSLQAGETALSR